MKKTITTIIAFMVLQTSMFGWHESFTTDATPDASGDIVSDLNWSWWGAGPVVLRDAYVTTSVVKSSRNWLSCRRQDDQFRPPRARRAAAN